VSRRGFPAHVRHDCVGIIQDKNIRIISPIQHQVTEMGLASVRLIGFKMVELVPLVTAETGQIGYCSTSSTTGSSRHVIDY
jgi:hypothetical protein